MGFSDILAANVLVRLIRGDSARAELAVSMTGPKLGDRLLMIGLTDAALLAALAPKVGITGRTCGTDPAPEAVARAAHKAAKAGVLVELKAAGFHDLPFDPEGFDIVVIRPQGSLSDERTLATALGSAARLLRNGGRCLVVADGTPGGLRSLLGGRRSIIGSEQLVRLLANSGFRGARVLAEREGLAFIEGIVRRD